MPDLMTKDSKVNSVELIEGPSTGDMTRTAAEHGLQQHPAIRKGAAYALEEVHGHWVAAILHEAAPPFGGGGPADAEEEAPGPKSEGPDDQEPSEGGGDPSGDSGPPGDSEGGDKPPHEKGGEKGELSQLMHLVQMIGEALGVPMDMGASPVPGQDPSGGLGPSGPPGPGGPMGGPPGMGGPAEQHVIHEKTMKPGDTPPGGTPIGSPFASVRKDHPWAHLAGKVATWELSEKIGDEPLHVIAAELDSLSREIGYRYKLREATDNDGDRVAVALITKH